MNSNHEVQKLGHLQQGVRNLAVYLLNHHPQTQTLSSSTSMHVSVVELWIRPMESYLGFLTGTGSYPKQSLLTPRHWSLGLGHSCGLCHFGPDCLYPAAHWGSESAAGSSQILRSAACFLKHNGQFSDLATSALERPLQSQNNCNDVLNQDLFSIPEAFTHGGMILRMRGSQSKQNL